MNLWLLDFSEETQYWIENDPHTEVKIKELIKSIKQNPFSGIAKPEPLKYDLEGFGSRRISNDHRLIYKILGTKYVDQRCVIVQCRFHYGD